MLNKLKGIARNILIYFFMSCKNDLERLAKVDFLPECYQRKNIVNSSVVVMYTSPKETVFFRECRVHKAMKKYVFECIDDYYESICARDDRKELKESVLFDLSKNSNYKRLVKIEHVFDKHLIDILAGVYNKYDQVGLPSFHRFEAQEDFIAFIKYVLCIVISQKTNKYLKNGTVENNSANKQLATYHLAKLLKIENIIPRVWVSRFNDGGKERVGTMMEKAQGQPPSDILPKDRKNFAKGTFLRDITNLEYFDALCYQLDHRLDNYYVTSDEMGKIDHVVAFDNDAARTFFVATCLPKKTYAGVGCVLSKDNKVMRPYMDKVFADRLLSVSKAELKDCVGEYLSFFQLCCLNKRIEKLQRAIKKTILHREDFLVSDWESVDTQNLADKRWGKTYFDLYLNDTLMLDRKKQFEEMKNNA